MITGCQKLAESNGAQYFGRAAARTTLETKGKPKGGGEEGRRMGQRWQDRSRDAAGNDLVLQLGSETGPLVEPIRSSRRKNTELKVERRPAVKARRALYAFSFLFV